MEACRASKHTEYYRASFRPPSRSASARARQKTEGPMAHPHMPYDPEGPIKRLRELCLALPEATEKEAWGECTFRVGGKMFAMTDNHHHGAEHCAVWVK